MKKIILALAILFAANSTVLAHHNSSVAKKSIFDKVYKYKINTTESHIGHFYIKKARVSRKGNEKLKIEHTIHLDSNIVKKFNIKYNHKTSLISYDFDMDDFKYSFSFYIKENLLTESNPGAMTIYNKADNTFTVANVTLDPLDESESEDDGHEHEGDDGHSHS